jgi:chromosome segregation ATPase
MTIFDGLSDDSLAVHGPGSTNRNRKLVEPAFDSDGRRWPVPATQHNDVSTLENTIAKQSAELNLRCTQVADLYNLQQRQANDLEIACEEIDRLSNTISTLLDAATQYEAEDVVTKKRITSLENEKAALRTQLDKAIEDSRGLARRLLAIETAFNDREIAITSTSEKVEALNAELTDVSAERFKLVATLKSESQRHRRELSQQKAIFEKAQANIIEVFEARLRAEREAAQSRIQQLAEELVRERLDHSAESRASAAMRKEITFLLPKLSARRNEPPEPGASMPRNNAA